MPLDESSVDADPLRELARWLADAYAAGIPNAEAMALATAGPDGRPSVRFVLLKRVDARGLAFYTSTESRKARELAANPAAAAALYWVPLGRQARAAGSVVPLAREEAEAYFATRPLGSRLAAWVSRQSEPIGSRAELEQRMEAMAARFDGLDPPAPPHWGGYLLAPDEIELWEHRDDRLHDRVRYLRGPEGRWRRERLQP